MREILRDRHGGVKDDLGLSSSRVGCLRFSQIGLVHEQEAANAKSSTERYNIALQGWRRLPRC